MGGRNAVDREVVSEGFGFFVGNSVSTLVLGLGSIVLARLLGADGYGLYGLSFVVPSILFLGASLGVNFAVVRFVSAAHAKGRFREISNVFNVALLFRALVGLILSVLGIFFSDFLLQCF